MAVSSALEIDKPLRLSELLGAAIRLYGQRPLVFFAIGLIQAGAFVAAQALPLGGGLAVVSLAFVFAFAIVTRVVSGDRLGTALAATARALPSLVLLAVVVGVPFTLGSSVILLWIVAVLWLALTAFAIPVLMLEREGIAMSLRRTIDLARIEFLHALGVTAALFLIDLVIGILLARALSGYADQTQIAAIALTQLVLSPFFFLGLTVLYFEQQARARKAEG